LKYLPSSFSQGITCYSDLFSVYLTGIQNNYADEDIKKFSEVIRKLQTLDTDRRGSNNLRMKSWGDTVNEIQVAAEVAAVDMTIALREIQQFKALKRPE
jgi:hypothetical protein